MGLHFDVNSESETVTITPSTIRQPVHAGCWVIMGVSGCGKSTAGRQLAQTLNLEFIEGDDAHSEANVAKMAAGQPLNDADRQDWLMSLAASIGAAREQGRGLVLSCSALKRRYRDILCSGNPDIVFVHLHGEKNLIARRLKARSNHFMPAALLDSQFTDLETLQADERGITLSVDQSPDALLEILRSTTFR